MTDQTDRQQMQKTFRQNEIIKEATEIKITKLMRKRGEEQESDESTRRR